MGNNEDSTTSKSLFRGNHDEDLQQVTIQQQTHSNARQRHIGLIPSDGQDAHKRASTRASKRCRAERMSYLMATGHLDLEETEQLKKSTPQIDVPSQYNDSSIVSNSNNRSSRSTARAISADAGIINSSARPSYEQSLLDEYNQSRQSTPSSQQHFDFQREDIFGATIKTTNDSFKKQKKKNKMQSSYLMMGDGTGGGNKKLSKFKQTTYTEVTLPMKTSPAFEYIIKDNRHRNRRCCLWFVYSTLVTIFIAIIVFSSVHLVLRYQGNNY